MRSLHQPSGAVKTPRTPMPSIDDWLRSHPLPASLAHMGPVIRKFPSTEVFLGTLINLIQGGCKQKTVNAAIRRLGDWHATEPHRCSACLNWGALPLCVVESGNFHLFSLCAACVDRIQSGQATEAMQPNLSAYAVGVTHDAT